MRNWYIFIICIVCLAKIKGQIIYHNLNPDVVFPAGSPPPDYSVNLDLDGDGIIDYQISQSMPVGAPSGTFIYGIEPFGGNKFVSQASNPDTLLFGTLISTSSIFYSSWSNFILMNYPSPVISGIWGSVNNRFLGVCFNSSSGLKYGWIRFLTTTVIADYAYNSVSNQSIFAGEGLPYTADHVQLADLSNNGDGTDINLTFSKTLLEPEISGYRVMIVPSSNASDFTLDSAKRVLNANSFFIPKMNKNIDTTLNPSSKDVYGNLIVSLKSYKAFVVSLPNLSTSFDTLISVASNELVLTDPNLPVQQLVVTSTKIPSSFYNLNVTFNVPSGETDIYNYRLFFIHEKDSASFTIDSANKVLPAHYIAVSKTGANQNLNYQSNLARTNKGDILKPFEKYRAVLMSVADTVNSNESALSHSSHSFTVYTQVHAVNQIIMSDEEDHHDISDIRAFFKKVPNESNISAYRGLIVPETSLADFNLDSANAASNYMSFIPNGQDQYRQLPAGLTDIYGNPVIESKVYHFFVLAVNDNNLSDINALSSVSKYFLYTTPHCLYAGDTQATDYHNINDTTIAGIHNYPPQQCTLDLNSDGVMDIEIRCYDTGGLASWGQAVEVTPLNNSQCNFSETLPGFIMVNDSADMIHAGMNWSSSSGILRQRGAGVFAPLVVGIVEFDTVKFMALRLVGSDTVYAWLKVSVLSSPVSDRSIGIKIHSYGLQKKNTGIIDSQAGSEPEVYPNPAVDYTKIVFHDIISQINTIELMTIESKILFSKAVSENEYRLNTSGLAKGIYALRIITTEGKSRVYKLIIQ